jgi:hypothetical protein
MMTNDAKSKQRSDTEARSRKAAERVMEGAKAMADYVAEGQAVRAKTARLKELRLAKEATESKQVAEKDGKSPARRKKPLP